MEVEETLSFNRSGKDYVAKLTSKIREDDDVIEYSIDVIEQRAKYQIEVKDNVYTEIKPPLDDIDFRSSIMLYIVSKYRKSISTKADVKRVDGAMVFTDLSDKPTRRKK